MPHPEPILEPEQPIVDPHHHLWDRPTAILKNLPPSDHGFMDIIRDIPRYLLDELLADLNSGHNVVATVYMECGAMYRADGPEALRCVGETEFVNGVAAMSASGLYGPARACAGIVGHVDLRYEGVEDVLRSHIAAGHGRFRGIRQSCSWDADPNVLGPLHGRVPEGLYRDAQFRRGFACLAKLGLSFDAWLLEPQLPDLIDLARAFPDTTIVLDHVGTPLGIGAYAGRREERFGVWRENIRSLAKCENVHVKLGGLPMPFAGWRKRMAEKLPSSETLAQQWKPYIDTCIEAFSPARGMFESNFPVDRFGADYASLWNAFKRLATGYSASEKTALFSGTAKKVYRLNL
ncbi:MAG: amidohydrolase family protein [Alphaproteobacteria bacterium]|nr:amidohydrolase family protein [Alphaproteobacteria bacterium]MBV9694254.1 amidohydrolase family protein [Alphaproteobacteria bacterium]